MLEVFRSEDRRTRVEVLQERGVQRFRIWRTSHRFGDCRDLDGLEVILRTECGLGLGALIED